MSHCCCKATSARTTASEHLQQSSQYVAGLQQQGAIHSSEAVFLDTHGGDLNGFFLIRGDSAKLDALLSSPDWVTHMTRAALHRQGSGHVRGVTGALVAERMGLWTKTIPA